MTTDMPLNERLALTQLRLENAGVKLEHKDSKWYWTFLSALLFFTDFKHAATTIGNRIGLPIDWDLLDEGEQYEMLLHESVHIGQYKKFGVGSVWFGTLVVGFAYLFLFFPIGLAYCRARIELEGYSETIRAVIHIKGPSRVDKYLKSWIVDQFIGPSYLYMWPFKKQVEGWVEQEAARVLREEGYEQ